MLSPTAEYALRATDCPDNCGDETILVVEDEPSVRFVTVQMLAPLGYTGNAASQTGIADATVAFLPKPFSCDALSKTKCSVLETRLPHSEKRITQ